MRKQEKPSSKKWRTPWGGIAILIVMFAGLCILLYPTIADWVNQYNQSKIISNYNNHIDQVKPSASEQLKQAEAYNKALRFGVQVKAFHRIPTGSGKLEGKQLEYSQILNAGSEGMMGRIRIKTADVDLPIYHGTSDEVLLKGIGHLEGSSLPVGGKGTHTVLTGHRGLAESLMFTNLDKVKVGDTFVLEILGKVLTYRVKSTKVVQPSETESLRIDPEKDQATLITCTPLGINTHRILVTGERIIPTPEKDLQEANKPSQLPRFPWWIVVLVGVLAIMVVTVYRGGKQKAGVGEQSKPIDAKNNSPAIQGQVDSFEDSEEELRK